MCINTHKYVYIQRKKPVKQFLPVFVYSLSDIVPLESCASVANLNSQNSMAHGFQSLRQRLQNKVAFSLSLFLVGTSMGTTGTVKFMAWLVYHTVGGIL
jgi:uncharacterized membrane protein